RDLEVGGAEGDLGGALRLVAEERHVPQHGLHAVGELAGGVELDEFHRHLHALCQLAREVGRDALRRAIRLVPQHEEEVAVVEADAQLAGRGEVLLGGGRNGAGHSLRSVNAATRSAATESETATAEITVARFSLVSASSADFSSAVTVLCSC